MTNPGFPPCQPLSQSVKLHKLRIHILAQKIIQKMPVLSTLATTWPKQNTGWPLAKLLENYLDLPYKFRWFLVLGPLFLRPSLLIRLEAIPTLLGWRPMLLNY